MNQILAVLAHSACEIFDRFRKMDSARKGTAVAEDEETNIRSAGQVRKYLSHMFCHLGLEEPAKKKRKKKVGGKDEDGDGSRPRGLQISLDAISHDSNNASRTRGGGKRPHSARPRLRASSPGGRGTRGETHGSGRGPGAAKEVHGRPPRRPQSGSARIGGRAPHRSGQSFPKRSRSASGSRDPGPMATELASARSLPAPASSGWDLARRKLSIVKRSVNGALQASEDMRVSSDIITWMARSVPGPTSPRDAAAAAMSGESGVAAASLNKTSAATSATAAASAAGETGKTEKVEPQPGGAVGFGFASTPLAFVVLAYDRMLRLIFTRYAKVTTLVGGASGHTFEEHARAAEFITQGTLFRFMSEFSIVPRLLTRKRFFEMMNGAPRLFRAEDFVARLVQCASLSDVAGRLEELVDGAGLTSMKALFLSVAREAKTSGFREVQELDPAAEGGMDAEGNRSIKIPSQMIVAALQSSSKVGRSYRAREEERSDGRARLALSLSLALPCPALLCDAMRYDVPCSTLLSSALLCSALLVTPPHII